VIAAISKMPEKDQVEYTIYGTGPSEDTLKSLVQQLELEQTVHFKGAVKNKDLPAIMPEFDVFIQPSFKETFGLSYFEAMACGLPVILTRNTGAYEMIKDKDVYYLVDPHKPEDIMDCLRGILDDRETMLRKATLAPEVAKIASWDTFVDYFHHIYSHI
jgi:glycosyltransferase involved in cell wall biosynthesis